MNPFAVPTDPLVRRAGCGNCSVELSWTGRGAKTAFERGTGFRRRAGSDLVDRVDDGWL